MSDGLQGEPFCFFSEKDFNEFSVLRRVREALHAQRNCIAEEGGTRCPGMDVEAESGITTFGAVKGKKKRKIPVDVVPEAQHRDTARRKAHTSARMGLDKLQVRVSAETPYDLDIAAASDLMENSWYSVGRQSSSPRLNLPSSDREDEHDFLAKLRKFKGA